MKTIELNSKLLMRGLLLVLLFLCLNLALSFLHPQETRSALSSASATLSNSRLSYRAGVADTFPAGRTTIDIDTSANADNNTNHLFVGDAVCFSDVGENGCKNSLTYAVRTVFPITDTDTFVMSSALAGALANTDLAMATASGTMTVAFGIGSTIPVNGDIKITIPAVNSDTQTNDGLPDTNSSLATNGFDLNGMTATEVSVSGGTGCTWTATETLTAGTSSTDHTIVATTTTACTTGTITATIGGTAHYLVNPAPITSGHAQGTADYYAIGIATRDAADITIESANVKVAPIEAVFVSATVEEILTFSIAGVGTGYTACGTNATTDVTTYAYSVPFGTISSSNTFYDAEQTLTVSTNATSGYKVYVKEDDELGKDGADSPNIPDTLCNTGTCTHTSAQEWTAVNINGFGYSLQDISSTNAKFEWDDSVPTTGFSAKHFPNDTESPTQYTATDAEVMSDSSPVSASSAYVCYRLDVSGTQQAGLYYNTVKYIATATF